MTAPLVIGSALGTVGECSALGGAVLVMWFAAAKDRVDRRREEHLGEQRAREAQAAAIEASLEEEWFAPEEIHRAVNDLLETVADVWQNYDESAPAPHGSGLLIQRWARSLAAWLGDGLQLVGDPSIDLLQVINRPGEIEDRVVVRLRLQLRGAHPISGQPRDNRVEQRWTLVRKHQAWTLAAIDADPLSPRVLAQGSISADWADQERLREASLVELADADATDPQIDLAGLISADAPPAQQLIELAQMDGRFNPDLIESRVVRIVEAWDEACTGSHKPLAAVALPAAVDRLLYLSRRGERDRVIVRDVTLTDWTPKLIDLSAGAPKIGITLTVSAVHYLTTADGRHLTGSTEARHAVHLDWTLMLGRSEPSVWQLAKTNSPAEALPGMGESNGS